MHEDWGSELRSVTEHDVLSRHQTLTSINWPQGPSPRDCHKLTLFSKIVRGLTSIDHILAKHRAIWLTISHVVVDESTIPTVWVKKIPPAVFWHFFPNGWNFQSTFFTLLLYDPLYTRLQIFIQLFPTVTKLCHTKRDHKANFCTSL